MSTKYIKCDCYNEVLELEYDSECNNMCLSILTKQYDKPSFWDRFRYIKHILKNGTPYSDQMILSEDSIKELKLYLDNLVNKKGKKK